MKYETNREEFYTQIDISVNDYDNHLTLLKELFKNHPRKLAKYCSKLLYIRKNSQLK